MNEIKNDCLRVSSCLARYLKEEKNIVSKVHIGAIISPDERFITPHVWISVDGSITDLTSSLQDIDKVQNIINGKKIGKKEKSKRLSGFKIKSTDIKNWEDKINNTDTSESVSSICEVVSYKDTFIIPYERALEIAKKDKCNYDDFLNDFPIVRTAF